MKIPDARQTLLSQSGEYVAFLCDTKVYVHSIALLDGFNRLATRPATVRIDNGTFLIIPAPRGTVWRAMSLSRDYLALRGYYRNAKQDFVRQYPSNSAILIP